MSDKETQQDERKLPQTVSLELETDLRLHTEQLELGNAELLTDALTLPFANIEQQLARLSFKSKDEEIIRLRKSIKAYLARLNANPFIPLSFRLKVLRRLERHAHLFDGEMTAAALNAYKIGIQLVQEEAKKHKTYYPVIVDLIGKALNMAVEILRLQLVDHVPQSVIATRQALSLMRLGLALVPALPSWGLECKDQLFRAVFLHEFLRRMDYFGLKEEEQRCLWHEINRHTEKIYPLLLTPSDPSPSDLEYPVLMTHLEKPHLKPEVANSLPKSRLGDVIVIPIKSLTATITIAVREAQRHLRDTKRQKRDLKTEALIRTTLIGGQAILKSLVIKRHGEDRRPCPYTRVLLEWDAAKAFIEQQRAQTMEGYAFAASEARQANAWSVTDISKGGVGLERVCATPQDPLIGTLVGLNWIPYDKQPLLGFVRWYKKPKANEERIGIEFVRDTFLTVRARMKAGANAEWMMEESFPLLVRPGAQPLAIFPFKGVTAGTVFFLRHKGELVYYQVMETTIAGANFSICSFKKITLNKD